MDLIIIGVQALVVVVVGVMVYVVYFTHVTLETLLIIVFGVFGVFIVGFALLLGVTTAWSWWTRSEAVRQEEYSRATKVRQNNRIFKYIRRHELERKQFKKALALHPEWNNNDFLRHNPKSSLVWALQGEIDYHSILELDDTLRSFNQAIKLCPNDLNARILRAAVYSLRDQDHLTKEDINYCVVELGESRRSLQNKIRQLKSKRHLVF